MQTTHDDSQAPAAVQTPSDEPLKLTHNDLHNLISACDDAISAWQKNKADSFPDYVAGQDECDDEDVEEIDRNIKRYEKLKERLTEEAKHCERCRKVAPLSSDLLRDCYLWLCDACWNELEA